MRRSEFGDLWLSQVHDWLHVRLEQAVDYAVVQLAILGRLELHLVDVSILVTNSARREFVALREALDDGDHLWSQLLEHAPISEVKQATGSLSEIPALVQALIVNA